MITIKKLRKKQTIILIGIVIVLILFLMKEKPTVGVGVIPGEWDISEEVKGMAQYLIEEPDFDYSHPDVYQQAQEIKANSRTPEEALRETLRFVVANVRYSSAITINYCFNEKASTVLRTGMGDCVSMTRLVISLLRAQGIPARSVGGCLSQFKTCVPVFSVIPLLDAQVTEMVEGDFKKRGYLHEWAEVYLPKDNGKWRLVEPTAGKIYPLDCNTYLKYHYDTNPKDRCIILSQGFFNQCKVY